MEGCVCHGSSCYVYHTHQVRHCTPAGASHVRRACAREAHGAHGMAAARAPAGSA